MYDLVAVVIHIGSSLNRGHYISIVKSDGFWLLFDDDIVDVSIGYHSNCLTNKYVWSYSLSYFIEAICIRNEFVDLGWLTNVTGT